MRRARVDANQKAVVQDLRAVGAQVQHLHAVGRGCPDLLVGFRGVNYLLEVKDGNLRPSAQKLNKYQVIWHDTWDGQAAVVTSSDEALAVIGAKA